MNNYKKIKMLFSLMIKISPSYIFLVIFGSIFKSIQVFGNVIIPKFLIDELTGSRSIDKLIIYGTTIVLFNLVIGFINKSYARLLEVKNRNIQYRLTEEMANKIMAVEYKFLEDPYYLDLKERALFACRNQDALSNIVNDLFRAFTSIITVIGLITIMLTLSYILILILFVGIIINYIIGIRFRKYQSKFFESIIPINRQYGYYLGLPGDPKNAKDIRLYNMSPLILDLIVKFNLKMKVYFAKYYRNQGIMLGIQRLINGIQTGFIYFYVSLRVFTSNYGLKISIGDFTMYISSAISFTKTFDEMLSSFLTINQMLGYLDPFMEFMTLKDMKTYKSDIILSDIEKVEFKNVSFIYPKSDIKVLDNISFSFAKGEKISIVGLNGAGKTTLIKLLCRLYQPTSGEILVNDINIFDYDYESYVNRIAAVFQDYRLFAYSILENITGDQNVNHDRIDQIIKQVGLEEKINELSNGLNSRLNKSYDEDGVELSGGQGQKVAIARALYKDAHLIILDEPTSALDPIAEAEIYQHFNELVLSKTAVYISHRMSSSIFCDRILIIQDGKVSDFDTHSNLMQKKDSLYYKLFTTQSKNYQID